MPPHLPARVLRAFLALWFVLSVGEPSVVQVCPMHGGGLLSELAGASPMGGMAMDGAAGSGQQAHTPATQHHCTCLDCCVGAGTVAALPSASVRLAAETVLLRATPAIASAATLPRPAPSHAQPPGTGPPRI